MTKLIQIGIVALLAVLPSIVNIRTGKRLTHWGRAFTLLALVALVLEVVDWYASRFQQYELRESDISFVVRAERGTGDLKSWDELRRETLESFAAEYLLIGKAGAEVQFADRAIKRSTGYRAPMRVNYIYHSDKLRVVSGELPRYVWDLNGQKVNLKVPKLMFGSVPDKWRFFVALRIANFVFMEQETDGSGKVVFEIHNLDRQSLTRKADQETERDK